MTRPEISPLPELKCLHCGGVLSPSYSEIDGGEEYTCNMLCNDCGSCGPGGSGDTMDESFEDACAKYGRPSPSVSAELEKDLNMAVDRIGVYLFDVTGWSGTPERAHTMEILREELSRYFATGGEAVTGGWKQDAFLKMMAYIAKRGHAEGCSAELEVYRRCACGWDDIMTNCVRWKSMLMPAVPAVEGDKDA